jgi:hypothetical protein
MRTRFISTPLLLVLLAAPFAVSTGCSKGSSEPSPPATAEATEPTLHGIAEGHDGGSIVWEVKPDGKVRALVKTADGKPPGRDVRGTLVWKGPSGDTKVPLTFDDKTGMLVGSGPRLEGDLTEIRYTVTVAGNGWAGALHVPAGGTDELEDSARRAVRRPLPKGRTGPNGGIVQMVGEDPVEVVADKTSGQVRAYVLDANYKPVPIGNRRAKLGLVGGSVETLALSPGPGGLYFTGRLGTKVDPVKLTIAITVEGHTDVALFGYEPGVVVVVGPEAPALHLLVAVNWSVEVHGPRAPGVVVVDDEEWRFRGHWGHGHWGWHGHGH